MGQIESRTLVGHTDNVLTVSYSPNSGYIASGGRDKLVKLWDFSKGTLLRTLKGHSEDVNSLAFSPHSFHLVSGSSDKTVRLWRTSDGTLLHTFRGHPSMITSVCYSPNSSIIASSCEKYIYFWNIETKELIKSIETDCNSILCLSFSPNGNQLVSGSSDGQLCVWNVNDGVLLKAFQGDSEAICSVAWSKDSSLILSGNNNNTCKVWELNSEHFRMNLESHTLAVSSVAMSNDLSLIITCSLDKTIKLWNAKDGSLMDTLKGHTQSVNCVCFTESMEIISGSDDKTIRIWPLKSIQAEKNSLIEPSKENGNEKLEILPMKIQIPSKDLTNSELIELEQFKRQYQLQAIFQERELQTKEEEIELINSKLFEQSKKIKQMELEIKLKNQQLKEKEDQLKQKMKELEWKEIEHTDRKNYIQFLEQQLNEAQNASKGGEIMTFPYNFIEQITNNFDEKNIIGRGSFGDVFLGYLSDVPVAIKKLSEDSLQTTNNLLLEFRTLQRYRHPNVVTLIGTTDLDDLRSPCLIYEYLPQGSLRERLNCKDNTPPLSWYTRIKIAYETANGLSYLHSAYDNCPEIVIHHDIKTENILLGSNCETVKLGDFGIVRRIDSNMDLTEINQINQIETNYNFEAIGTRGYICPALAQTGEVSTKTDIYSFGVVLFELLTGSNPLDSTLTPPNLVDRILNQLALPNFNCVTLLDPRINISEPSFAQSRHKCHTFSLQVSPESIQDFISIAVECVSHSPSNRPSIDQVQGKLKKLLNSNTCICCGVQSDILSPSTLTCDHSTICSLCFLSKFQQFSSCPICKIPLRPNN